jgi:regulator of sirC expression with transglutaminase-like and TPR domain
MINRALADVNKTLELNPDMAYAYTTRANINYKLNDYKKRSK